MRQARHKRSGIEFIHLLLKEANHLHAAIHAEPLLEGEGSADFGLIRSLAHRCTPDMWARTSNTTAKSFSTSPMPRAAVKNSLVTAVEGMGTSNFRPSSKARSMSFCIMFTLNQASSGKFNTKGPRYLIMGEAIALLASTSTAISRGIPLFSARRTPSENASICTARLRLQAIFSTSARPLSPTYVTLLPMCSRRGLILSKVDFLPPTMTDSLPSWRVITLPDTGASTISAPLARTFSATDLLYS